ncbi:MAG TPA: hypothetical protein RMH99_05475 [Sandaracinaceae bacterium LLY-WYZ-13_1]|nr:hypothetical protein [Sandaracinaceae bacterium LLY-WYZ-13_1]
MADDADREKKTIEEHVKDLWDDVLGVLESLVTPPPELVPVPVRHRRPRRG